MKKELEKIIMDIWSDGFMNHKEELPKHKETLFSLFTEEMKKVIGDGEPFEMLDLSGRIDEENRKYDVYIRNALRTEQLKRVEGVRK